MIIEMRQWATDEEIHRVVTKIAEAGLQSRLLPGRKQSAIKVIGGRTFPDKDAVKAWPGVERVLLTLGEQGISPAQLALKRKWRFIRDW